MKVRYLRVAAQFYVDLCKGLDTRRMRVTANTLPSDAKVVDAKITDSGWLMLVVWSDTFPDIPAGETMPEHPIPQFELITKTSKPIVQTNPESVN